MAKIIILYSTFNIWLHVPYQAPPLADSFGKVLEECMLDIQPFFGRIGSLQLHLLVSSHGPDLSTIPKLFCLTGLVLQKLTNSLFYLFYKPLWCVFGVNVIVRCKTSLIIDRNAGVPAAFVSCWDHAWWFLGHFKLISSSLWGWTAPRI